MIPFTELTLFKTNSFIKLRKEAQVPGNILVVGCGDGNEVACLSEVFPSSNVYGIDIDAKPVTFNKCVIEAGDAQNLRFNNNEFDLIYSYHVIEHITDPVKAISEMSRVLRERGDLLIGTPNRDRLLGYMSGKANLWEKTKWNLRDWRDKLRGRFRNELGAHAGYSHTEMREMLTKHFSEVKDVTQQYYEEIYKSKKDYIKWIYKLKLQNILFPAVYYRAKK
jgi:ubiquinone/menaquinone biosynthesis C-methylase UbiE